MRFTQIRYSQENSVVRYRTGLVNYEEALVDGRWLTRYWNATGFVEKEHIAQAGTQTGIPSLEQHTFDLQIDGQNLHFGWKFVKFIEVEKDRHCIVELENEIRPIRVKIHTQLDGTAIISRWLEITNTDEKPAALSEMTVMAGLLSRGAYQHEVALQNSRSAYTLGYFTNDDSCREGNFQWLDLPEGRFCLEGLRGRSGHGAPFFILKDKVKGTTFIGTLGWSANWKINFKYERYIPSNEIALTFTASPWSPAPMRIIAPQETIESPIMHLGCVQDDTDTAVQQLHNHIRQSVMPPQPKQRDFRVVYNHWSYTEHELTEEKLYHEIDIAADLGAEVFIVDAGWYADANTQWWLTTGDWQVGNRLPNGLAPIREYAHKKGLLFGLWCEVERAGELAKITTEQPDWILKKYGKPLHCLSLDLTNPDAAHYVEKTIFRLIEEHQLDLFRLDYNTSVGEGGQNLRDGFMENTLYRHCETIYAIFDRVRAKHPNVLLENCSSGGGRCDLGLVSRFHHTWVTDNQVAPESIRIFNGMSMFLPPEYIDRNCGVGQDSHLQANLAFQIYSCMLGHFTLTGIHPEKADYNPEHFNFIKECVSLYKKFIRPMLPTSSVYHHTPAIAGIVPTGWAAIELVSADTCRAVAGIFRLQDDGKNEITLRFRGLHPGKTYNVTFDTTGYTAAITGQQLINQGLTIRLDAVLTSQLILLEQTQS